MTTSDSPSSLPPRDLRSEEAAALLGVAVTTLQHWLRTGRLRGYRAGGTRAGWRIPIAAIEQFRAERLQEQEQQPQPEP